MIKLSKMSDHALVVSLQLAKDPGARLPAAGWAARSGLPEATVAKLLKQMCSAGITMSARGKMGGYGLALDPAEVSILSIVEAIDGPVALTDCSGHSAGCGHAGACGVRPHVNKIELAMRESLRSITIKEMSQGEPHGK